MTIYIAMARCAFDDVVLRVFLTEKEVLDFLQTCNGDVVQDVMENVFETDATGIVSYGYLVCPDGRPESYTTVKSSQQPVD